jgi:hypothetical protein
MSARGPTLPTESRELEDSISVWEGEGGSLNEAPPQIPGRACTMNRLGENSGASLQVPNRTAAPSIAIRAAAYTKGPNKTIRFLKYKAMEGGTIRAGTYTQRVAGCFFERIAIVANEIMRDRTTQSRMLYRLVAAASCLDSSPSS